MNTEYTEKERIAKLAELESKLTLPPFPSSVILDTANLCNYRCAGCARAVMTRPKGKMPISLARKVLAEVATIAPNTKLWLTFYGEPSLIAPRVAYLAQYGARLGCRNIFLNTNASHLDQDAAEMMLDCGITDIILSLDAATAPTYDAVRQAGLFDRVTTNALNLIRRARATGSGVRIHAQMVNGPANRHEREEFVARWLDEGVSVKIKDYINWTAPVKDPTPPWRIACPWAFTTFVVLQDGGVPCCGADYDARHRFGDVLERSVANLWNNEMLKARHLHLEHRFSELPAICRSCGDWNVTVSEILHAAKPCP